MTKAEIKAKWKALHDTLSESYYANISGLTKKEFDWQHGKIWNDMEAELIAEGYKTPPKPRRNLEAEFDSLKADIKLIKDKMEIKK